jgi:phosphoglycerate dehydrogenase-like enzyme
MTQIVLDVRVQPEALGRLASIPGVRVAAFEPIPLQGKPRELPIEQVQAAEILACTLPPSNLAELKSLRLIQLSSVGYAQLYGLGLSERGIRVANARGVYDTAIAEWNVAMMVNLARDLPTMLRNQQQGRWSTEGPFHQEIRGSVVGLWGYGGIGRETARLAKALGMRVHVLSRKGIRRREQVYCVAGTGDPEGCLPDRVFTAGQEEAFLAELDFLVLAMPHTPANHGIVSQRELRSLKRGAFLLNPARGPLVDESALLRALSEGWIAGAALDTHFRYPLPPDDPLWAFPQVIVTPHISGSDRGPHYLDRFWEILLHNVEHFLTGKPLWNELTAAELGAS